MYRIQYRVAGRFRPRANVGQAVAFSTTYSSHHTNNIVWNFGDGFLLGSNMSFLLVCGTLGERRLISRASERTEITIH